MECLDPLVNPARQEKRFDQCPFLFTTATRLPRSQTKSDFAWPKLINTLYLDL